MLRFVFLAVAAVVACGWLVAAPVPTDAKVLVAGLTSSVRCGMSRGRSAGWRCVAVVPAAVTDKDTVVTAPPS